MFRTTELVVKGFEMIDDDLVTSLEELRNTMIAVATGGPRINDVNDQYQRVYAAVAAELARRRIENPITYGSLWDWYGRWSSGDLPTYQSRRTYIGELVGLSLPALSNPRFCGRVIVLQKPLS